MTKEIGFYDFPSFAAKCEWWHEVNALCAIYDDCTANDDGSTEKVMARAIAHDKWISKMFEPWNLLDKLRPSNSSLMFCEVPASPEIINRAYECIKSARHEEQAQADAYEKAASHFEEMGPAHEMFCDSIADELRALAKPVGETT